jgi:hypothetical protein
LSLKYWTLFLTIAMIMIISFYNGDPVDFIYFKF